jgi:hypothetical protein
MPLDIYELVHVSSLTDKMDDHFYTVRVQSSNIKYKILKIFSSENLDITTNSTHKNSKEHA